MTVTRDRGGIAPFEGFRPEAIQFLADLAENNTREWFKPRKGLYEALVKEPMGALCVALAEAFAAHQLPLRADPASSPFRIHRDVRFARDKTPYKTAASASFPWIEDANDPERSRGGVGAYFHLEPGNIYLGGGMWHPERERLAAFREAVDRDPGRVLEALEDARFKAVFDGVTGEALTRNPKGFDRDHAYSHLLRLKGVVFGRNLSDEEAFSPDLADTIARDLDAGRPVLRFLAGLGGAGVSAKVE